MSGTPSLLLLTGERGIGKTRLCEEIASLASAQDMEVAWGRAWEAGGAPPFWPWIQVLRALAARLDRHATGDCAGSGAPYLAQLIPDVFTADEERKPESDRFSLPAVSAVGSTDAELERFRMFDAIGCFLRNVSALKPLLILLDDLHAADEGSILLARFIIRNFRDARIAVVAAYREVDAWLAPQLRVVVGELQREGVTLALRGLSRADVKELVEFEAGGPAPPGLDDALYEVTEGNPFFLNEVVRLLVSEERFTSEKSGHIGGFRIPKSVHTAIERSLDLVPAPAREILSAAAVIGREFDRRLVGLVCGLNEAEVLAGLEGALASGLVKQLNTLGELTFSHFLVRETIYDALPTIERRRLHRAIAEHFELLHENGAGMSEVAHHYFNALPDVEVERAVFHARRAAQRAMRSLAYEEASRLYEMAFAALRSDPASGDAIRCEILLGLGEAQSRARQFDRYRETFTEAAAIARKIGDNAYFARAALGFSTLGADPGRTDPATVDFLKEALGRIGEGESPLRPILLARLAEEIRWTRPKSETRTVIDEAVTIARRLADPSTLIEALYIQYHATRGPNTLQDRLKLTTEIQQLTESHGLKDWEYRARYHRSAALLEAGAIRELERELEAMRRIPEPLRLQQLGFTEIIDAVVALMTGRIEESERLAEEAFRIGRNRPNSTANQIYRLQITAIRREQGRLCELLPTRERAHHVQNTVARCMLAFAYSEAGQRESAGEEFERLADGGFGSIEQDFTWFGAMAYLTETCASLGDVERASLLYRLLSPYAESHMCVGFLVYLGSVHHYLGLLARTVSCLEDASAHFETAYRAHLEMGASPWAARSQLRWAETLLLSGRRDQNDKAQRLLARSIATARTFDLRDLSEKALALKSLVDSKAPAADVDIGAALVKEGDYWTANYGGTVSRLKDVAGMRYISRLLNSPNVSFAALDLLADCKGGDTGQPGGAMKAATLGLELVRPGDAGEMLDPQAKAAYRRRLVELREELDEARHRNDSERAENIEGEIEALARELARALGLGGRDRRAASDRERARLNVTRAIKLAIERIENSNPAFGLHLRSAIKTGAYCTYTGALRS